MRDPGVIRDLVRQRWTGNLTHDLIGFTIDELVMAKIEWQFELDRRNQAMESITRKDMKPIKS